MKAGYLSEFFSGVAMKTLSAVEADAARSNQHEYNGDRGLMKVSVRLPKNTNSTRSIST